MLSAVSVTALQAGCANLAPTELAQFVPSPSDTAEQSGGAPQSLDVLKANYESAPDDAAQALAYASALKQLGARDEAYAVLGSAVQKNGTDKAILSEYGRLALELNQIAIAKEALARADDPEKPDWRVVMARGTVLAKEGHYQLALPYFERAFSLEPRHPSVLSNLALAYTMTGQADKGEPLLRNAIASGSQDPRLQQNLALVLKVQGKSEQGSETSGTESEPQQATGPLVPDAGDNKAVAASKITTSSIGRASSEGTAVEPSLLPASGGIGARLKRGLD